jgi:hypothetical protein
MSLWKDNYLRRGAIVGLIFIAGAFTNGALDNYSELSRIRSFQVEVQPETSDVPERETFDREEIIPPEQFRRMVPSGNEEEYRPFALRKVGNDYTRHGIRHPDKRPERIVHA